MLRHTYHLEQNKCSIMLRMFDNGYQTSINIQRPSHQHYTTLIFQHGGKPRTEENRLWLSFSLKNNLDTTRVLIGQKLNLHEKLVNHSPPARDFPNIPRVSTYSEELNPHLKVDALKQNYNYAWNFHNIMISTFLASRYNIKRICVILH